jgi:DNA-binding NarL/FixJ family response regulator
LARTEQEAKDGISRRKLEVLRLATRGLSNRQIAHHLQLAEATVKRHLANLYPKMGVRSLAVRQPEKHSSWVGSACETSPRSGKTRVWIDRGLLSI